MYRLELQDVMYRLHDASILFSTALYTSVIATSLDT